MAKCLRQQPYHPASLARIRSTFESHVNPASLSLVSEWVRRRRCAIRLADATLRGIAGSTIARCLCCRDDARWDLYAGQQGHGPSATVYSPPAHGMNLIRVFLQVVSGQLHLGLFITIAFLHP